MLRSNSFRLSVIACFSCAFLVFVLATVERADAQESTTGRDKKLPSSFEQQREKPVAKNDKPQEKDPEKPTLAPKRDLELQKKKLTQPPIRVEPKNPPTRVQPPLRQPDARPKLPQPRPQTPGNLPPGMRWEFPQLGIPPSQAHDTGSVYGDSLRIATCNTRLTSPIFNKELFDSEQSDVDANIIADRIIEMVNSEQAFDIIALNEVWDEDSKNTLVTKLSPLFPYYVKKFDEGNDVYGIDLTIPKFEDSGLMLFSRFPMESFRAGSPVKLRTSAFRCFSESSDIDKMAAKGVGVVVIRNPASYRLYVVAFTHLQDKDESVRVSQMKEIEQTIRQIRQLNPETTRGEVFVMGDLNIAGCSPDDVKPLQYNPTAPGEQEWRKFFWNQSSYFTFPLYDSWAWTTSAFDRGFTSPGGGSRLDYIIHEFEPGHEALAVQHIHYTLSKTNSDHGAIVADLNRPAPFCNPRLARRPDLEPKFANESWDWEAPGKPPQVAFHSSLRYPGSMQWYRFEGTGTYSFAIPVDLYNEGLRLTLYQKDDLTTPIDVYKEETSLKMMGADPPVEYLVGKYHIPSAPFFVRVSNPTNRAWYGGYSMAVHKHKGKSMEDAITLFPGEEAMDPHPPTSQPLNPEDQIWFELYTDQAHSGEAQDLEFFVKSNPSGKPLELTLLDSTGLKEIAKASGDQPSFTRQEKNDAKWYLTLKRKNYTQTGMTVAWTTNLTWLIGLQLPGTWPLKLVCGDETSGDALGSDEIDFFIDVDGIPYFSRNFGDFDSDEHRDLEGLVPPVAFVKSMRLRISENDNFDDKAWNECTVWGLDPKTPTGLHRSADLLPADGNYEFRYNFAHGLNKKQP